MKSTADDDCITETKVSSFSLSFHFRSEIKRVCGKTVQITHGCFREPVRISLAHLSICFCHFFSSFESAACGHAAQVAREMRKNNAGKRTPPALPRSIRVLAGLPSPLRFLRLLALFLAPQPQRLGLHCRHNLAKVFTVPYNITCKYGSKLHEPSSSLRNLANGYTMCIREGYGVENSS